MSSVNEIPKDWVETTLGEVVERITKGTTPKEFSTDNNDINYIKSDALQYGGFLDSSRFVKITSAVNDKLKRSKLKKDDILLSMAGEKLGKTGLVNKEHLPANTNQAVAIITVNKEIVNHKFIWYKLRNKNTVKYFKSIPSQSAQPNINFQEIRSLPINLPSLPEQKAIANILTAFDDKIENLQAQNNTLEQTAQTIFKEWFGKYQVGDELPDGWRTVTLNDVVSKSNTGADAIKKAPIVEENTGIRCLRIGDLSNNRSFDKWGFAKVTEKNFKQYQLKRFDIVVTRTSILGLNKLIMEDLNAVYNNGLIKISLIEDISPYFIYGYFRSNYYKNYISMINNDTSTRPNMKIDYLLKFPIIIPSKEIEMKFSRIMESTIQKISQNTKQIQTLKKTSDTLLPKLMSGQIRVNEFKN